MNLLWRCVASAAILVWSYPATAQDEAKAPGLKVGQKAPTFQLEDQLGNELSLEKLLESSNVALVFYRSADW